MMNEEVVARLLIEHGNVNVNATISPAGQVHWLINHAARCGVGKCRKHQSWQMELGEVTCRRCLKLIADNAPGKTHVLERMKKEETRE